ncbi:glycosyl hydrolase family 28-related protein [Antarcticimicrobium luteum]|uniref:Right-handed parallel beta-helix repeat-containing protein n=1 Tax=Antarcticimicrobium luteum TaxID=2547397 RepID=A0A4R5USQ0_9RHOB|nr:glycosyl hydrolase family 28-related protein [Antarcticimicrobium luteum]TDK42154.1 right-handed parallel beta-helix repeat-containing protein [Antarcticimicrobium luteum]
MNKAITEALVLMPPAFAEGLDVWSSGNGTPGSDTYDGAVNAALVAADQDFGGCLELQKTDITQQLRYMGQTPLIPGCYLQIRVRVKALSGALPTVRIAGWPGGSGGHVAGLTETAAAVTLTTYGQVVELSAIVGTGARGGVDMVWGMAAQYGYFGIDLTGANGGVVRVDDIEIADVTGVFLRDMLSQVDVRDYGALGDGVSDDSAAFAAADADADGRRVFVPAGSYFLAESVTLDAEVAFEGTVTMPDDKMLLLTKSFDLPHYIAAFDDEELAFKKAFQALLNNADHESLDMGGRKVTVTGPIDMQAAVPNKSSYSTRRVVRNGQLEASAGAAWDTDVVTSQATYSVSDSKTLSNVTNVANVPVGALVGGTGVGREVYVTDKRVGAQEITLSRPLYDAVGTQNFTFRDFKYMLDFSGFSNLSKFALSDVEVQCEGLCSGIRLAVTGTAFQLRDCFVSRPRDRGVTSIGTGCQGMLIDRCQFLSDENAGDVADRSSIALNANANDVKLRNNRAEKFRHFAVLAGSNNVVTGNHFFQGDGVSGGVRTGGLVLTASYSSSTITSNYVDNCFIEWTNEHDSKPDFVSGFSFSALSIADNIFLSGDVAPWFSYVVIKPHGTGNFLNGVNVTGNMFRSINGTIDRAERVDTSFADLDYARFKNVTFAGNTYHAVTYQVMNPLRVRHSEGSAAASWTIEAGGELPFGGRARGVDGIVTLDPVKTGGGATVHDLPYVMLEQGSNGDKVKLVWSEAVKGEVALSLRIDT